MSIDSRVGCYSDDGSGRRSLGTTSSSSTRLQLYSQAGQLLWATSTGGPRPASSTAYVYLGNKAIAEANSVSGTQYLHTDALGSPVARSNATGALINRTRYEPYGFVAAGAKPSTAIGALGFTGHVQDAETDLVYMQQRYYDPIAGRFLSVDPVVTDAETGKDFGRYIYVDSNPYAKVDPDGRNPVRLLAAVVRVLTKAEAKEAARAGAKEGVKKEGEALSQRAAAREAKREADIPTSQQPISQTNARVTNSEGQQVPVGRQQTYETPKPGGGTETKSVQVSRDIEGKHAGQTQIEAGRVKEGGQTDAAGRPRIQNEGKVRIDFDNMK